MMNARDMVGMYAIIPTPASADADRWDAVATVEGVLWKAVGTVSETMEATRTTRVNPRGFSRTLANATTQQRRPASPTRSRGSRGPRTPVLRSRSGH